MQCHPRVKSRVLDYYRAITEYERLLFFHRDSSLAPEAEFRIALSYLKGGKPDAARAYLRNLASVHTVDDMGRRATLTMAGSYYAEGDYAHAADEIDTYLKAYPAVPETDSIRLLQGLCRLREGEKDLAVDSFRSVALTSRVSEAATGLAGQAKVYENLPHKSAWLAGSMSAALPGAGQLYVGRPQDAAIAFILNGVLIWGGYEAFDKGENVAGVMLAVVEAGWYFGNIYNAANNAHKFNRRQKDTFFRNVEIRFAPALLPDGDWGGAGGVFFKF
ncbi:MAG: tetratricopeptide repeat protein [bacterium]